MFLFPGKIFGEKIKGVSSLLTPCSLISTVLSKGSLSVPTFIVPALIQSPFVRRTAGYPYLKLRLPLISTFLNIGDVPMS